MSCLINSLDDFPKIIDDIPVTTEGLEEYFNKYVFTANGVILPFKRASYQSYEGYYIYFNKNENINDPTNSVVLNLNPTTKELSYFSSDGQFDPLNSLTICKNETICGTPVCDDGKEQIVITPTTTKIGNEYAGTSDKAKPTSVPQYSIYLELDTGKFYYYDDEEWNEIPCCGGSAESEDDLP